MSSSRWSLALSVLSVCTLPACVVIESDGKGGADQAVDAQAAVPSSPQGGGKMDQDGGTMTRTLLDASLAVPGSAASCATTADGGQLDTDGDGTLDGCDVDDDGDGFRDEDDLAPLDRSQPGDFSTPEAVLSHPLVVKALAAAKAKGAELTINSGSTPPDISGFYLQEDGLGKFIASDTEPARSGWIGNEFRLRVTNGGSVVDSASVAFAAEGRLFYAVGRGALVRGEGTAFTRFSRIAEVCTEEGANYTMSIVSIQSAKVEPATGNFLEARTLFVTVATAGKLTSACASRKTGSTETVGGWSVGDVSRILKKAPSELKFLCVDGAEAYAPTETWKRSDGTTCTCGNSSNKPECK